MTFMMTDSELITSFRHAGYARKQVRVLAELNAVSINEMHGKLVSLGLDPGPLPKKKEKPKYKKPKAWRCNFDEKKALRLLAEGRTSISIKKEMHISNYMWDRWRKETGQVPDDPFGLWFPFDPGRAMELYREGHTDGQIVAILDTTDYYYRKWKESVGLVGKTRRRKETDAMCFEQRDAQIAALCHERDLLKSELEQAKAALSAVTEERDALLENWKAIDR